MAKNAKAGRPGVQPDDHFQMMLDLAPLCCFSFNDKYEISACNQYALKLFEVNDAGEFAALGLVGLSPEHQPDGQLSSNALKKHIKKAMQEGSVKFEWVARTDATAELPCDVTLVRSHMRGEPCVMAYLRDKRELKNAISLMEKLEEMAFSDALTGLSTRRYFMEMAEKELRDCIIHVYPFHLLMIDIDFFKRVNDTYGHPVGDEVLIILAERMRTVTRPDTLIARYGGEEFIVMLPRISNHAAEKVARRIRKNVADTAFEVEDLKIDLTVSIGLASKTNADEKLLDLIKHADEAMYAAKHAGRNTVRQYHA